MNWALLLQNYGYLAVFVGAFFEGETVLLLGAYAVQQHYLQLWPLMACGAAGGFFGDQFYYGVGRWGGQTWLAKRPKLQQKFDRASRFIHRYPVATIFGMRFAWGLRTILPVSFGVRGYAWPRYASFNVIACCLWSAVIVVFGVQLSRLFRYWWGSFRHYQSVFWVVVAVAIVLLLGYRLIRKR